MTDQIEIIENFFWIVHVHNKGAAWGILQGFGWLLSLLALVALTGIFLCRRTLQLETNYMQVVFGLLCAGIVGNLVDRLRLGYVIDFLDFLLGSYHWPAFNVADSAIFCGVGLYLIYSWRNPDSQQKK
jgi:signal peptidase II